MSAQSSEGFIAASDEPRFKKAKFEKPDIKISGASLFSEGMYYLKRQQFEKAIDFFKTASEENGYPPADLFLAIIYLPDTAIKSEFAPENPLKDKLLAAKYAMKCQKNLHWFTGATWGKEAQAFNHFCMGHMYKFGIARDENPKKSFVHYREAERLGHKDVLIYLAECFQKGFGVAKDANEALTHFTTAAEYEDPQAQSKKGDFFYSGYEAVLPSNQDQAELYYKKSAQNQSIVGQRLYGNFLLNKADFDPKKADFAEGMEWLRLAAKQGDAAAQYSLGWCYCEKRNQSEGRYWKELAANQGFSRAQYDVAKLCLERSLGYYTDEVEEGFRMLKAAADSEYPLAQYDLADCYINGCILKKVVFLEGFRATSDIEVIPKNVKEGIRLYSRAAELGNKEAVAELAQLRADPLYSEYFASSSPCGFFARAQPDSRTVEMAEAVPALVISSRNSTA